MHEVKKCISFAPLNPPPPKKTAKKNQQKTTTRSKGSMKNIKTTVNYFVSHFK
jgi:hypothetical protein